jgi:L-serine dehydratase
MQSIRDIFRIGMGPCSSHTMAPRLAAELFSRRCNSATEFRVALFGSLALTGRAHLTHEAITQTLVPRLFKIIEKGGQELPLHPNGMIFEGLYEHSAVLDSWRVYSMGGSELLDGSPPEAKRMSKGITRALLYSLRYV